MSNTENERAGVQINVAYLTKMILSKWWVIVLAAIVFGAVGFVAAEFTKTVTYSSQISFVVSNRQTQTQEDAYSSSDLNASITLANTYKYILSSRTMCEKVAQTCSFDTTAEEVSRALAMSAETGTNIIVMTISTPSAAKSYDFALAVIHTFGEVIESTGYSSTSITVCEMPVAATRPNADISALMYLLIGAFGGVILALIVIMILNITRNTIQSTDDIHTRLDLRILGLVGKTVPRGGKAGAQKGLLINSGTVGFSFVETYKAIRTKIENMASKKSQKVFLISSAAESEGKTTVATNLAIALAQNGHSVLLIDADLRKPSVCRQLGLSGGKESRGHGLADVLTGASGLEQAIRYVERHKLFLLASSNAVADPAELLSTSKMEKVIRAMRNEFDFVIIDTAPAGVVTDASILANYVDAALLVIREDYSSVEKILNAIDDLSSGKAELAGCVYNIVSIGAERTYNRRYGRRYGREYGYYGYGYGYGYNAGGSYGNNDNA